MNGLNIQTSQKQIIISLDKKSFDETYLLRLLERMNIEYLAKKAGFNKKVLTVADDINELWWSKNGKKFIKPTKSLMLKTLHL